MLLYLKATHIVFVVSWFAGLFYLVRLFIYHAEADEKEEAEKQILQKQFKVMENRLWKIITVPAMILTLATGIWMGVLVPAYFTQPWMHFKLLFIVILLLYNLRCWMFLRKFQSGSTTYSPKMLRLWNEGATVLLVAIVFVVVLKDSLNWVWGLAGLLVLGLLLMAGVRAYRVLRK